MAGNYQDNRVRNTTRNIIWGLLNGVVSVMLPFIARAIILFLLGADFLGIGTLFTSVLQFLSLTELGLGTAIIYTMYRPIAEGNTEYLCEILNYIKKMYQIIGFVMLVIGTILVPAVPYLIHGDVPKDINVYILYYIYLINSVISYFFAGYRESLLTAHQRRDVSMKWATFVSILMQVSQIVVLVMSRNFYAYAIVPIVGTIATNIIIAVVTRKMFPEIMPQGRISDEIKTQIKSKLSGLIGTKISAVVHHSSDTIVISAFLGLTLTAQYGNYYLVLYAACGFIATIFTSMTASIGDKLVRDSIEQNYFLFKHISFANNWLVGWCTIVFVCLLEPLINLVYGQDMCLGIIFSAFMGIYFYVYQIQKTILTFKDAAGIWYADRYRPYVIMITNLVSNIILVNIIGIYGIVISTILSLLISLPWLNWTLYDKLFHRSSLENLSSMLGNGFLTAVLCFVTYFTCSFCHKGLLGLIEMIFICLLLPNLLFVGIYRKSDSFVYWKHFVLLRFLGHRIDR